VIIAAPRDSQLCDSAASFTVGADGPIPRSSAIAPAMAPAVGPFTPAAVEVAEGIS
jgi:hypothetical protein